MKLILQQVYDIKCKIYYFAKGGRNNFFFSHALSGIDDKNKVLDLL